MAAGYKHPKVKVHVGDGFKFLDDYKNSFDVIITDSSDPEGPAESLFQKPYFKLLHDALREGGVITTQGCTFPSFLESLGRCSRRQTACLVLSLEHSAFGPRMRFDIAPGETDFPPKSCLSLPRLASVSAPAPPPLLSSYPREFLSDWT